MKLRTFGRHTKQSLKNLGRNGWMTFASVSAVTVSLLLVGLFFTIMLNLNSIANQVEDNVVIRVFIDHIADEKQKDGLGEEIKKIDGVQSVTFISKEDGLKELIESMGDDAEVFQSLQGEENPLPDAYEVKTQDPRQTAEVAKEIKDLEFVSKVNYGKDYVNKLFNIVDVARNVGIVLIIGLLFTSIFMIANTIKLTIVARSSEIEIMKLVGATNSFVRWPFFLEGLMLGVMGAIVPVLVISFAYRELYDFFISRNYEAYIFIKLIPYNTMALYLALSLIVIGGLIGVWGSMNSVRKFLKV